MLVSNRTDFEHLQMSIATLIILILLLAIIVGITIVVKMALSKLNPAPSSNNPSPAPAAGNSTATPSASSGGSSSSGQKGKGIPNWIMILGIAYLVIRGLLIIWINYITQLDWIIIIVLALLAIVSFWNGKNRWLALVLVSAIACILWFNQAHIDSFKPKPRSNTEQSAQQEQVAPAPIDEIIYMDPILPNTNSSIDLVKTGNYKAIKGKNRLCLSRLGDMSSYYGQLIKIEGVEYKAGESGKCYPISITEDTIYVEFVYPPQTKVDTYLLTDKEKDGQGVYPFLEPVK
jgi:hypothetical protein